MYHSLLVPLNFRCYRVYVVIVLAPPTNSLLSLTLRNRKSSFVSVSSYEPCCLHERNEQTPSFMSRRSYQSSSNEDSGRRSSRSRRRKRSPPPPIPSPGSPGRGCFREIITPGLDVTVVQKQHQRTGNLASDVQEEESQKHPMAMWSYRSNV